MTVRAFTALQKLPLCLYGWSKYAVKYLFFVRRLQAHPKMFLPKDRLPRCYFVMIEMDVKL